MSEYGEVIETGSVRFVRLLPGPIERVWSHLVDSELRGTWLATGELEPRVGGKVTLHFDHQNLTPYGEKPPEKWKSMQDGPITAVGRVVRFEAPRVLAITWAEDSEVSFELEPKGPDVQLTLTHRRLAKRSDRIETSAGWHSHLGVLEERLRGEVPQPFWPRVLRFEREYEERMP